MSVAVHLPTNTYPRYSGPQLLPAALEHTMPRVTAIRRQREDAAQSPRKPKGAERESRNRMVNQLSMPVCSLSKSDTQITYSSRVSLNFPPSLVYSGSATASENTVPESYVP